MPQSVISSVTYMVRCCHRPCVPLVLIAQLIVRILIFADPAAPVGKGAQRTQEVDKTPTPPPQEVKDTPEAAPTATGGSSGGASDPTDSQKPAGGFSSFIEGLKSNFGQSSQSKSEDKGSIPETTSTALEGNPSPSPSLTAGIEAETDKNSEKPAVQALIEGLSLLMVILAHCVLLYCRHWC